jgi:hypothetical protein
MSAAPREAPYPYWASIDGAPDGAVLNFDASSDEQACAFAEAWLRYESETDWKTLTIRNREGVVIFTKDNPNV